MLKLRPGGAIDLTPEKINSILSFYNIDLEKHKHFYFLVDRKKVEELLSKLL